ncbi:hypothetical protein J4207_01185 [Candidatus Woesearchaeota archaeon]|nr:hypothetical protein [Candidatus Woesearchaeota archaeon]
MTATLEGMMSGTKHATHHAYGKDHGGHGDHAKPKHLDDFFEGLKHGHDTKIEESLEEYKGFSDDKNLNHLFNNVFTPAQDDFYKKVIEELEHVSHGHDETKTHKKKEGIQKAVAEGLVAYFEKSHPSIKDVVKDMNTEEKYETLTAMYDDQIGADGKKVIGLSGIAEEYAGNKKMTIGDLKKHLDKNRRQHKESALAKMVNHKAVQIFHKYHPTEIGAYLKPKVEEAGLEVEDKVKFATLKTGDYINILKGIEKGDFGEGGYVQYGLRKRGTGTHEEHEEHTDAHGGTHH